MAIGDVVRAFGRRSRVVFEGRTWEGCVVEGVVDLDDQGREVRVPDPPREPEAPDPEPTERRAGQVRGTSLEALEKLRWGGKLTPQQMIIVSRMREGGAADYTRQEISRLTHLAINAVCGRVDELRSEPILMLEETAKRRCRATGESAMGLRLTSKS